MFYREVWPVRLATRNLAISARYVRPGRAVPEFSLASVPRVPRAPHPPLFRAKVAMARGNANFRRSGKRPQEA